MKTFTTLMMVAWAVVGTLAFVGHDWITGGACLSAMASTWIMTIGDDDEDELDEIDEAA